MLYFVFSSSTQGRGKESLMISQRRWIAHVKALVRGTCGGVVMNGVSDWSMCRV